ncbi:hypothetical protein NDN08_006087 [Rhodosorus marinus]|uniref:Aminoglycoside phosphotransferase domain-containing protein n=1 Tax=Rhodosorus marinus TaxID=101924 RepID=A0AAV8UNN3_9RHOD|nr:hypothetical protein NDN08_006087 [Rhodosorus marinus]
MNVTSIRLWLYRTTLSVCGGFAQLICFSRILWRKVPLRVIGLHSPTAFRVGDSSVSKEWLSGLLGERVVKCTLSALPDSRGMVGDIRKLSAELANGSVTHLALKTSHNGWKGRRNVIASGAYREHLFYSSPMLSGLKDKQLSCPLVYYSFGSGILGEYVILMDDLTEQTQNAGLVFGNQIWGVPENFTEEFSKRPEFEPLRVLYTVFEQQADMNAMFFNDPTLLEKKWLKGSEWHLDGGRMSWISSIRRAKQSLAASKQRLLSDPELNISKKLISILEQSFDRSSWELFVRHLGDPQTPFTLCHGDLHAKNLLLTKAGDQVLHVDWAEVCVWEPGVDLAQMLISDVKPSVFRAHSRALVTHYWERLISKAGLTESEYPFESCWESFCSGGVGKWLWVFAIMTGIPELPAPLLQYFHDQLLAFIEAFCERPFFELRSVVLVL